MVNQNLYGRDSLFTMKGYDIMAEDVLVNYKLAIKEEVKKFESLVRRGLLGEEDLHAAAEAALHRDKDLQYILRYEYKISSRKLLEALSNYYKCPWIEYDERMLIPPELLYGLDSEKLCVSLWFPVARLGSRIIIAACNPKDEFVREEVEKFFNTKEYTICVALSEDIQALIQDFLCGPPDNIIGKERTGLSYWRNTMAEWRTRLAGYRTNFAKVRTYFSLQRKGLGLIAIARLLMGMHKFPQLVPIYWAMIVIGFILVIAGFYSYFMIKHSRITPPDHRKMLEITAATLMFLRNYQFFQKEKIDTPVYTFTLAHLFESLKNHCVFIASSLDNKIRSALSHERTALAARRTIAACFRTVYARGRTGLSFMRSGVAFVSLGLGLMVHFGLGVLSIFDVFIILVGIWMLIDGTKNYLPVRKEQSALAK